MFYSRVKHSGKIISAPGESELKAPSRSDSIRIILGRDCFYCLNQYPETAQFSRTHCCRAGDVWDCGSSYYLNQYPETAQFSRTHCCRAGEVAELVLTEEEEKEEAPSDYPGRIKKPDHFQWSGLPCLLRREGDSNPRYGHPYGSLANCWFKPLTHRSKKLKDNCWI